MDAEAVIVILNELLAGEEQAFGPRLFESTVFISQLAAFADWPVAQRLAHANRTHRESLTELIVELGGTPDPRSRNLATADLHYQDIRHVLRSLITDHDVLIRKYEMALPQVGSEPRAARLVTHILAEHRAELDELEQLHDEKAEPAPSA